jgi:hypothetical protein
MSNVTGAEESNMREPYVKPVVMQLHYSTDQSVSMAEGCKVVGSGSGPTVTGCQTDDIPSLPCSAPGT